MSARRVVAVLVAIPLLSGCGGGTTTPRGDAAGSSSTSGGSAVVRAQEDLDALAARVRAAVGGLDAFVVLEVDPEHGTLTVWRVPSSEVDRRLGALDDPRLKVVRAAHGRAELALVQDRVVALDRQLSARGVEVSETVLPADGSALQVLVTSDPKAARTVLTGLLPGAPIVVGPSGGVSG